ncbi:MAG TPA: efflux RND transporter periplasmic adaptor subunit [Stellaceae bacterium]|nr:efflux RND transporter periplasmic adaptor subunit [Stellaceae bacterium]
MDTRLDHADTAELRDAGSRRAPSRSKLILRLAIMAILLFVVFGGLYAFERFREHAITSFFAHNVPPPLPVATATATAMAMPRDLPSIGSFTADHQVIIAPEVAGRVTQIYFKSGAAVQAGDPLVQINDGPERGDLANYQAQAHLAQSNLARARDLAAHKFETQANVDTYKAQFDQANAQIAKTEALIAEKLVRAPFAGALGIRQVDLGQYVNAGMPLVTLTDLDALFVNFTLPEAARDQVAVGQAVTVTVDAFPDRSFTARLTTIEPQVSIDTRTIKLQAALANPGHLLLPGMFAHVKVVLPAEPNVVTVPETAIDYTLYGDSVFLIVKTGNGSDGKPEFHVKRSFVTTGEHFDNRVAVLSGVRPGDRVVATGQLRLIDGAAVVPTADSLKTPPTVPVN